MDDEQRTHLQSLRQTYLRRLRILEQQAAVSGANTRPEVRIEIEDLQALITQTDAQLAATAAVSSTNGTTATRPTQPEQRRTQATILSALLVGASDLFATLDPEDAAELMGELWQRLDAVIHKYGGLRQRLDNNTFLVIWGAQSAREDDPERAIRAALAMQAALAAFETEQSLALSLRIGISTGLVLIGALGAVDTPMPVGKAAALANQLQQHAPEGGILIAHDTYRHVRGLFAVELRSDTTEPHHVYLVKAANPRGFFLGSRGVEGIETRMIGRNAELARLQEAFQIAVEDRELQLVTVVGEAGVGKSRLLHAFRSWEELQVNQAWLFAGRALPELMSQPFALLRDLFAFRFQIQDNDTLATVRAKLEHGFAKGFGVGDTDAEMKAHVVGQLLGFDFAASPYLRSLRNDPKQLHDRALHYLSQFIVALTRTHPLLLVLEDLHWADDASLDALAVLLNRCRTMPVLALCLARPALFERRPAWGEGAEGQTTIRLEPLSKRATRQLVGEILHRVEEVPSALREQIVTAAEGNPFYVEELIKMLIDEGAIVPGPEIWRVEAARLETLRVPPTLTGVLQARLDSLQLAERRSLERASVVGRVFWDQVLAHMGNDDRPEHVGVLLDGLRRRELVFRHEVSAFAGTNEYLFKHMLLREVTYERVLKRQKRTYHAQVASWLIAESGERTDEYATLIAEHYERAGEVVQAAQWHERAGWQAQAAYANAEAIAHYERALTGVPEERHARVLLSLGHVLDRIGEWEAAEMRIMAALALAEAANDGALQAQCRQVLGSLSRRRGDYAAARNELDQARASAVASGDCAAEAVALRNLGLLAHEQGDYDQAQAWYDESLALARTQDDMSLIAHALDNMGLLAHKQGEYDLARTLYEEGLTLARTMGHKLLIAASLHNLGLLAQTQGDNAQARALLEESLALTRALGHKELMAHTLAILVAVAVATNQIDHGVRLAGNLDALLRALGTVLQSLEHCLYDTAVQAVQIQLDAPTFRALWVEGQAMTLGQAVASALGEGEPPPETFKQAD
jgi:predicted ATPase/class 3 adenylate cyclase